MKDYIFVKGKERGEYVKIVYSHILFIKSNADYVEIHTTTGRHIVYFSMIKLIDYLPSDMFHRCSRSHIVNVDKIEMVHNDYIKISGVEEGIILSSGMRQELFKKINFISK